MTDPTPPPADSDVRGRRRQERRIWRNALLASLFVHVLVFLIWRHQSLPLSPFAAAGPRAGDFRAARGSMQAMNMRTPPSRPIVPPPVPVPTLEDVDPVDYEEEVTFEQPSLAGDSRGALEAPGIETGTGRGDGGDAAEGLNRMTPPTPRGMIIPPMSKKLKGEQVQVWVFVDERGRVVPDSTRLRPPTSDGDFNKRLIDEAAEWIFLPAQKGGQPVATWFPYTISM